MGYVVLILVKEPDYKIGWHQTLLMDEPNGLRTACSASIGVSEYITGRRTAFASHSVLPSTDRLGACVVVPSAVRK